MVLKFAPALLILATLTGCSAMFVPVTSDPAKKLINAESLYDKQQRPIPAEKLIREAIQIYQKENNQLGLAEAYRQYGFFFRSAAVKKSEQYYRNIGFIDKATAFDTRYSKSIEYFEKAKDIYSELKKYDKLTNVNLNIGFTYHFMENPKAACTSYEQTIKSHLEYKTSHPNANLELPEGMSSFEAYIVEVMKKEGC